MVACAFLPVVRENTTVLRLPFAEVRAAVLVRSEALGCARGVRHDGARSAHYARNDVTRMPDLRVTCWLTCGFVSECLYG
ncbi:hypothetical protein GCM10010330_78120 [Streptomyces tendae]|nr:hypothetical protein GCM10010330_78120 [Streptomyces tendae]